VLADESRSPSPRASPRPAGRGGARRLRKQLLAGFGVLDEDRADRAVLSGFQDLLDGVSRGIDGLRLTVVVQPEDLRRDGLTHRIADAHVVVDADAQLTGHWHSPNAR